ncbi:MAG: hypothetical protein ACKVZH_13890 [Blastocatellia bacterium]
MTEEEFERFLKWLDEDRQAAALEYEKLRRRLILYFVQRKCADAEDLADQVLDAAARQLSKQNSLFLQKPLPYIFGIARNLYRRYFNQQILSDSDVDWDRLPLQSNVDQSQFKEGRNRCLGLCLRSLKDSDRDLFLLYYLNKVDRPILAKQFRMTINAVRLRMMRLRDQLHFCIESCQENVKA